MTVLEQAIWDEPGLAFDLAKTLVESVCKTVLNDRGILFAKDDDLPKLYRTVTTYLPLLPASASSDVAARDSVKRALGGMSAALIGICELRNAHGFASHGSASERGTLESTEALLAAQAADAIVGFLYANHVRERRTGEAPVPTYKDNVDFNDYVDSANDAVGIFELEYQPSEVLFYVDKSAYYEKLADYEADLASAEAEAEAEDEDEGQDPL